MTKVTHEYELERVLTDEDAEAVARAHAVYGIAKIKIAPALDRIVVDYDATRLTLQDLENWLVRVGVPVRRAARVA